MPQLDTPLLHGKLELHNRLVMPPMATALADHDGRVNKDVLDYYQEKANGGYIALVIVEHSFVDVSGKASERQMSAASDSDIAGLRKLAAVIQANGAKAALQINHAGSAGIAEEVVGPSAVAHPNKQRVPTALTQPQIKDIVAQFQAAAVRAREAGFDAVEIHAAHGFLLNQFYSPLTNHRTDEYGGNILGRIRLHLEIIKAVREAVGEDFPLLLRLGGCDYHPGGSTVEDSVIAAQAFAGAGIDLLDISGGMFGFMKSSSREPGYFADVSTAVKQAVDLPVILTGGITLRQEADALLAAGTADLIGVGRAILKDSQWAKNALTR